MKKATKNRPYVLIRTYSAGVHFGELVSRKGKEVVLANARRIWRWFGANTLNEIATKGVDQSRSRISQPVASITLTESIEIIDVTTEARTNLEASPWATN